MFQLYAGRPVTFQVPLDLGLVLGRGQPVPDGGAEGSHVQKRWPQPDHGAGQIGDGLQDDFRVEVFGQVLVQVRLDRDRAGREAFVLLLKVKQKKQEVGISWSF